MPLIINLRHLESQNLFLEGEIPAEELDLAGLDELIRAEGGLRYNLEVERHERGLLAQGTLSLSLQCECARCLVPFQQELVLPHWCSMLSWEGEDAVAVRNDCVDLTPYVREDMVLALPRRPLCKPDCGGLKVRPADGAEVTQATPSGESSAAWAMLDNLKL
jgi:uncharacterized metal-binding protein YceD (DUF177 family)